MSPPEEGEIKEARDTDNYIIITKPQLKKISSWYNVMCGCECCVSTRIMNSYLLSCHNNYLKSVKTKSAMRKIDYLVKWSIVYLRLIKTKLCCMGIIFIKQNLTWPYQLCVNIHHTNMNYHDGNECCVIVHSVHILISQVKNQIRITQTHVLQYRFDVLTCDDSIFVRVLIVYQYTS